MTPYTHLDDAELVRLVQFWPSSAPRLTSLETELAARLANAIECIEDSEANLAVLAAKYQIDPMDLIEVSEEEEQ